MAIVGASGKVAFEIDENHTAAPDLYTLGDEGDRRVLVVDDTDGSVTATDLDA